MSLRINNSGAATLLMALILVTVTTLLIMFAANYAIMMDKSVNNVRGKNSSLQAAQGGLEFGIAYLIQNGSTITANPVGGYINYGSSDTHLTNVTLSNNSSFSVTYTNPVANNYRLLSINATGVGSDGASTTTITQQVYSAGSSTLTAAMKTQGNVVTSGNITVTGNTGIDAGGAVTQSGNVHISSIVQNDIPLKNMSGATLFSNTFGVTQAQMQSLATYHANSTGLNYNSLSGKNWINSNVTISGNYTIGTTSNPVLIVINGNFVASGNVTINGVLYVTGSTTMSGTVNFNGGIVSQGAITLSGAVTASYSSTIVGSYTPGAFVKLPGSWKDF